MKKTFLLVSLIFFCIQSDESRADCFLTKENDKIIEQEGNCTTRHAPCSTFKIAISLMAYNEGLLLDTEHPKLPFKKGYVDTLDKWKQPHNPEMWMKNSCVWYSQVLTQKLGIKKFKQYVSDFHYGNQDISGDKGKNNGLKQSWLSSSLEISPQEQIVFLQKLINNKLPVSLKSQEMTKSILFVQELDNGWKLYGKTGSGSQLNHDRTEKTDLQIGWFIGWIQKDTRKITFAQFIEDDKKIDSYASLRAKALAIEKMQSIAE